MKITVQYIEVGKLWPLGTTDGETYTIGVRA